MDEQQTQKTHENQAEQESYTSGGVTYVGAAPSRYGRLQDAVEEFRNQAEWLSGYLFIVGEHFADARWHNTGRVTERAAVSYLDAVPGVVTDISVALADVERLAAELRRVMAGEDPGTQRSLSLICMADVSPEIDPDKERRYRRGYLHGWHFALDAMRLLLRARQTVRAAYRACAEFAGGALSEWRYGDCARQETPPSFAPDAGESLPLPK